MGSIRKAVQACWSADGPMALTVPAQKALALTLFEGRYGKDKLAGTLALQELLLDKLTPRDVERLGSLFDRGLIADWNTCDWFCVKVLGNLIARNLPDRPERFAQTGVGWLLRELAAADRERVLAFTEANLGAMSREGVRYVVERMPKTIQVRLVARRKMAHGNG